jgi:hypothetical protein
MQKAELELPVKQFHQLYDLLGDLLDYESESGYFNMENLDIELMEDIRHELYNQIPDEETFTEYAVVANSPHRDIISKKLYKVHPSNVNSANDSYGFNINAENGEDLFCIRKGCAFLNGNDWSFITIKD